MTEARSPSAVAILQALRGETLTAEELAIRIPRELSLVLVDLVELELAGDVVRAPGGLYHLDPYLTNRKRS